MIKTITLFIIYLIGFSVIAQEDSIYILSYGEFIERVKTHHPKMRQAEIVAEMGRAGRQVAKGGFDPKLEGEASQKRFDDQLYYGTINGGLKLPTWLGITGFVGYDQSDGQYLNPQMRTPQNGLLLAGVEIELGNGLFIDQRRAELKKAKLFYTQSLAEQKIQQNLLIYQASVAFQKWYTAYQKFKTYERVMTIAETRYSAVQQDVRFGERPAIDTVEAGIQLQNRRIGYNAALLEWENNSRYLELYLWNDGYVPLELNKAIPVEKDEVIWTIPLYNDSLVEKHPINQINELLLEQIEVDIRLKKEQLKPSLSLKYNAIAEPINSTINPNFSANNYLVGGAVSYPLFTRKERGMVEIYQLKKQDLELKQKQGILSLEIDIKNAFNSFNVYVAMESDYNKNVIAYRKLVGAEQSLFENGESSLFMINSREKALIDSELDYFEIRMQRLNYLYLLNYLALTFIP
jgi:outer membrane protein TolC